MIRVTGTLTCPSPDDAEIVARLLPDHIRLSRAETGCLNFNVSRSANALVWTFDETFADRSAFAAHQTRTRASVWSGATAHLTRDFRVLEV